MGEDDNLYVRSKDSTKVMKAKDMEPYVGERGQRGKKLPPKLRDVVILKKEE